MRPAPDRSRAFGGALLAAGWGAGAAAVGMWTGRKIRNAAPSPGLEATLIQPSDCLTMP